MSDVSITVPWQGFKVVGDNIDKTIKPSFERVHSNTVSMHYYHSFALLDRVDLSGVSDLSLSGIYDLTKLLPSHVEVELLKEHFSILISRYMYGLAAC